MGLGWFAEASDALHDDDVAVVMFAVALIGADVRLVLLEAVVAVAACFVLTFRLDRLM